MWGQFSWSTLNWRKRAQVINSLQPITCRSPPCTAFPTSYTFTMTAVLQNPTVTSTESSLMCQMSQWPKNDHDGGWWEQEMLRKEQNPTQQPASDSCDFHHSLPVTNHCEPWTLDVRKSKTSSIVIASFVADCLHCETVRLLRGLKAKSEEPASY